MQVDGVMDATWTVQGPEAWEMGTDEVEQARAEREKRERWDRLVAALAAGQTVEVPYDGSLKERRSLTMQMARQAGIRGVRVQRRYGEGRLVFRRDDSRDPVAERAQWLQKQAARAAGASS
jgi:hypothetical protein